MGHLFLGPNSLSPSSLARAPSSEQAETSPRWRWNQLWAFSLKG